MNTLSEITVYKRTALSHLQTEAITDLVKRICKYYGVSEKEIMAKTRLSGYVKVRGIIYYCLRHKLKLSYPVIAKIFNRHHATIIHSMYLMERKYMSDVKRFL